ncbi:hypothetical protein JKI98_09720 [Acinetobacter nectaris]|nr:hypothetical protein [Acinetobacter nectaris]
MRIYPRNLVDNHYLPPSSAWITRFETNIEKLTVAYFTIQSTNQIHFSKHELSTKYFKEENSPEYWVPSHFIDKQKYHHLAITAYWSDAKEF